MKTILEYFLDALEIDYTKHFASTLYQEHPHKNNMYGLKKMLDVYDVKTLGVFIDTKDLSKLNFPCILHIYGDFIIGVDCDADTITYQQRGKETRVSHDDFKRMWTGNALVVEETTNAVEPDYKKNRRNELFSTAKAYGVPVMLLLVVIIGIKQNLGSIVWGDILRILLCLSGVLICCMLMEKQLFGESRYGDKVCSLFHHADCNSVLDGPMSKIFGISWSEIGLGYFVANILLLSLVPTSSSFVAVINWVAMLYGLWSVYYQWRIAKSWCVLCIIVQAIIWIVGLTAIYSYMTVSCAFSLEDNFLFCMFFAIAILAVHHYASTYVMENERVRAVQRYRSLKANGDVAKVLIEKGEYYETTLDDSSIIFGNPVAKILITILSNPHCNPCARMHKRVEKFLKMNESDFRVQYIFSSFNEELEDSSRYLISCYLDNPEEEALRRFALWYTKEKFDYKKVIKDNETKIHTQAVENEMEKHKRWRDKTSLTATPTILINGYKLSDEYELEDLAMIDNIITIENNILQDINGRSTTPLEQNS